MAEYDLLKKNELKFRDITLDHANLNDIAGAIARIMQLDTSEVLVTDYLDNVMTLDILRDTIYPHQILAKKELMLEQLKQIPGVTVTDKTSVFSEGMLGWIAADAEQAEAAIKAGEKMIVGIRESLAKRAIVFSTGAEVIKGEIEDTNSVTISETLKAEGYTVKFGGTLRDDQDLIAGTIRRAVGDGYTIVITTGGVGAERKDCTVEAVLDIDPEAATPYICTFTKGIGRHFKEGVRIAVGELNDAVIISLPGPNDEVRTSMPLLMEGLNKRPSKHQFAEHIAANLRDKLRAKMQHHGHDHDDLAHNNNYQHHH
jgi:molybdenum cofactor synthesis domain-containing protein